MVKLFGAHYYNYYYVACSPTPKLLKEKIFSKFWYLKGTALAVDCIPWLKLICEGEHASKSGPARVRK